MFPRDESYANRAKWVWDPFEAADNDAPLRIAGEINVKFEAAIDRETACYSAPCWWILDGKDA